ncbi:DNA-binding transcriptional regulator Fis [Buchnera aphidicola (Melanaphis sacchari)]|uniref:Putative Fis-like DNA-binding protein n=1 Tax=Buchnera aphidicola (Melanaphis sacchari) TaxID=2173854 RepID=A0A2U8DEZ2_9GAMM|nr:DNA-binding transcriptional regulator Fis [Buchnera aphidicola]AWH90396.1 DNA-binding transcriptional regulator Fis [Buchnera aphidicola (Melanaphis sacchari)]
MLEELINKKYSIIDNGKNYKDKIIKRPLCVAIKKFLENYLLHINKNEYQNNLYQLLLSELERPLLDTVMQYTRGNQTRAALIMGINRSTLRKKLKKYGMS